MPIFATNTSTTEYEPHPSCNERSHYLRKSTGNWSTLRAGLVIAEPEEGVVGDGKGDDTVFVLEGLAHVRTADGEEIVLKAGDFVSFPRGVPQTWDIKETFRAAFVYVE